MSAGPPGTNYVVMKRAFDEGWGAVIAKTVSLDSSKACWAVSDLSFNHSVYAREICCLVQLVEQEVVRSPRLAFVDHKWAARGMRGHKRIVELFSGSRTCVVWGGGRESDASLWRLLLSR